MTEALDIQRYEVQRIIGIHIDETNHQYFQVQWAPTWEPFENLSGCEHLVQEFWLRQGNSVHGSTFIKQEPIDPVFSAEEERYNSIQNARCAVRKGNIEKKGRKKRKRSTARISNVGCSSIPKITPSTKKKSRLSSPTMASSHKSFLELKEVESPRSCNKANVATPKKHATMCTGNSQLRHVGTYKHDSEKTPHSDKASSIVHNSDSISYIEENTLNRLSDNESGFASEISKIHDKYMAFATQQCQAKGKNLEISNVNCNSNNIEEEEEGEEGVISQVIRDIVEACNSNNCTEPLGNIMNKNSNLVKTVVLSTPENLSVASNSANVYLGDTNRNIFENVIGVDGVTNTQVNTSNQVHKCNINTSQNISPQSASKDTPNLRHNRRLVSYQELSDVIFEDDSSTENAQYFCSSCSIAYKSSKSLKEHCKYKHEKVLNDVLMRNSCTLCDVSFKTAYYLRLHHEKNHPFNVLIYRCAYCLKNFNKPYQIDNHFVAHLYNLSEVHEINLESSVSSEPIISREKARISCENSNSSQNTANGCAISNGEVKIKLLERSDESIQQDDINDEQSDNEERKCSLFDQSTEGLNLPYKCLRCYTSFKTPKTLRNHCARKHHFNKITATWKCRCTICLLSLSRSCLLKKHALLEHTDVLGSQEIFECMSCNVKFVHFADLYSHVVAHEFGMLQDVPDRSLVQPKDKNMQGTRSIHNTKDTKTPYSKYTGIRATRSNPVTNKISSKILKKKCPFCDVHFQTSVGSSWLIKFDQHMEKIHPGESPPNMEQFLKCPLCTRHFVNDLDIRTHIRTGHKLASEEVECLAATAEIERNCIEGFSKSVVNKLPLLNQSSSSTPNHNNQRYDNSAKADRVKFLKPITRCPVCPRTISFTSNLSNVNKHMRRKHSNVISIPGLQEYLKCPCCVMHFLSGARLRQHLIEKHAYADQSAAEASTKSFRSAKDYRESLLAVGCTKQVKTNRGLKLKAGLIANSKKFFANNRLNRAVTKQTACRNGEPQKLFNHKANDFINPDRNVEVMKDRASELNLDDSPMEKTGKGGGIDDFESNTKFQCIKCAFSSKFKHNYLRHVDNIHGKDKGLTYFQCTICKSHLSSKRSLKRHVLTKHPNNSDIPKALHAKPPVVCKSSKSLKPKSSVIKKYPKKNVFKKRKYTKSESYNECPRCQTVFMSGVGISNHLRVCKDAMIVQESI